MLNKGIVCFRAIAKLTLIQSGKESSVTLMCSDIMNDQAVEVLAEQQSNERCDIMVQACAQCLRTGWTNFCVGERDAKIRIELFALGNNNETLYTTRTTRLWSLFNIELGRSAKRRKTVQTRTSVEHAPKLEYRNMCVPRSPLA